MRWEKIFLLSNSFWSSVGCIISNSTECLQFIDSPQVILQTEDRSKMWVVKLVPCPKWTSGEKNLLLSTHCQFCKQNNWIVTLSLVNHLTYQFNLFWKFMVCIMSRSNYPWLGVSSKWKISKHCPKFLFELEILLIYSSAWSQNNAYVSFSTGRESWI